MREADHVGQARLREDDAGCHSKVFSTMFWTEWPTAPWFATGT